MLGVEHVVAVAGTVGGLVARERGAGHAQRAVGATAVLVDAVAVHLGVAGVHVGVGIVAVQLVAGVLVVGLVGRAITVDVDHHGGLGASAITVGIGRHVEQTDAGRGGVRLAGIASAQGHEGQGQDGSADHLNVLRVQRDQFPCRGVVRKLQGHNAQEAIPSLPQQGNDGCLD